MDHINKNHFLEYIEIYHSEFLEEILPAFKKYSEAVIADKKYDKYIKYKEKYYITCNLCKKKYHKNKKLGHLQSWNHYKAVTCLITD